MKCIEKSSGRRIYRERDRSSLVGLTLWGALIGGMALILLFQVGWIRFTCSRSRQGIVDCEVSHQPLLPFPPRSDLFSDVRGARVITETRTDDDGDDVTTYHVMLRDNQGERKAWSFGSQVRAELLLLNIESFLKGSDTYVLLATKGLWHPESLLVIFFAFILICSEFGLLKVIFWPRQVIVDRSFSLIREGHLTPFSGFRPQEIYSFRDVQKVSVEGEKAPFVVVLKLHQKPLLQIPHITLEAARAEAKELAHFLGRPVELSSKPENPPAA